MGKMHKQNSTGESFRNRFKKYCKNTKETNFIVYIFFCWLDTVPLTHIFFISFQLYGEKWNSSAPKFAANLGLSPLEPMKVTSISSTSTSSSAVTHDVKGRKAGIHEVPAAQFDWNSSGLINPLDGKLRQKCYYNIQMNSMNLSETFKLRVDSLKAIG